MNKFNPIRGPIHLDLSKQTNQFQQNYLHQFKFSFGTTKTLNQGKEVKDILIIQLSQNQLFQLFHTTIICIQKCPTRKLLETLRMDNARRYEEYLIG